MLSYILLEGHNDVMNTLEKKTNAHKSVSDLIKKIEKEKDEEEKGANCIKVAYVKIIPENAL